MDQFYGGGCIVVQALNVKAADFFRDFVHAKAGKVMGIVPQERRSKATSCGLGFRT